MVAVSLTSVLIFITLSIGLNVVTLIVLVGRSATLIQQITDFDAAVATLFTRLNAVLDRFDGSSEFSEPVNPIQMVLAQFLQNKMAENQTINNRNELGQFKTIEAK